MNRRVGVFLGANLLSLSFLFAAATPASSPEKTVEQTFTVELEAAFLRPDGPHPQLDRAITFGPVLWNSATSGIVSVEMWDMKTVLEFETSTDKETITKVEFNRLEKSGSPIFWETWRHRHGIISAPAGGYLWNSNEDVKERIPPQEGALYDRYLKAVWTYWVIKKLPSHLAHPERRLSGDETKNADRMKRQIRIKFGTHGVVQPSLLPFQISVWNVPVKISFEVNPSTGDANGIYLSYKTRWTYDQSDWRELHGYKKDLWGYGWDKDFPPEVPLTDETGKNLDALMDRNVSYWVDVATQLVAADLNGQLQEAMDKLAEAPN
jgi:hypothetical protein